MKLYTVCNGHLSQSGIRQKMLVVATSPAEAIDIAERTDWPDKITSDWAELTVDKGSRLSGAFVLVHEPCVTSITEAALDTWTTR
jgi:hypothetical protein